MPIEQADLVIKILTLSVIAVAAAVAYRGYRKTKDAAGVNFIINAESKIDPLRQGLVNTKVDVIRSIYRYSFDLGSLTDDDCSAFPFMQSLYSQTSRMYFLFEKRQSRLGFGKS